MRRAIRGPTGSRKPIEHGFTEPTKVGLRARWRAAAGFEVDDLRHPGQVKIFPATGITHDRLATIPSVHA
jgi:hypothetical protein